jgi:hypothetical protein
LVARVPRIAEIEGLAGAQGHAVAGPAKIVELLSGQPAGILRMMLGGRSGVSRSGSMAILASDTEFARQDRVVRRKREWPG